MSGNFFFSHAKHFHMCAEHLLPFKRLGGIFQGRLKIFKQNFGAVSIRVKQQCSFFDDKSHAISVKHNFPLSNLRTLAILLFDGIAIHNSLLKFVFDSSGTWKQEAELQI